MGSNAIAAPPSAALANLAETVKERGSGRVWHRRLRRDRIAMLALVVLALCVGLAVAAPMLDLADPIKTNPRQKTLPIGSDGHLLGTDQVGRDILSRLIWGARTTLMLGVAAAAFSTIVGLIFGLMAGYFGGWTEAIIMRTVDVLLAFPAILLAIIIVAILGPSLRNALIAIAVLGVPFYIRLVRAEALRIRSTEFILAAQTIGAPHSRIVLRHVVPNVIAPIIVTSSIHIGYLILEAGGLSFLGLGAQPPSPEWGAMVASGRNQLMLAPHVVLIPSAAIFVVVLAFNLLGDGLRDALDPKSM
ncbi:MAG: peptide/nickel transport system permease protein [Thermomicrobiales bacterium]|nr:peptide/nickel transport system permease protein [Thermomicrobiales bacterium]MEA2585684.1 peptide/nickel transport system permease protein [Thermomicrobiales bacterium]